MLRNLTWQAADDLVRTQLSLFRELADKIDLTDDDRRRALDLDDRFWQAWLEFVADGRLPNKPGLPEMLRRLASAAFALSVVTEQVDKPERGSSLYCG